MKAQFINIDTFYTIDWIGDFVGHSMGLIHLVLGRLTTLISLTNFILQFIHISILKVATWKEFTWSFFHVGYPILVKLVVLLIKEFKRMGLKLGIVELSSEGCMKTMHMYFRKNRRLFQGLLGFKIFTTANFS